MKIRKGFVSNSSSQSFVCDVCGYETSGWDLSLSEAEMVECENGHTLCQEHVLEASQEQLREILDKFKMVSSMSRPGSPTDNQPIETFWKTMKTEMDDISHKKFNDAKKIIIKYIECFYNSQRLHTSLDYKTPNEVWNNQINKN